MCSNTESCTHKISGCFVQYDSLFPINVRSNHCLCPLRISVQTNCNCSSKPHILRLVSHKGSLHQMVTWSSQNSVAGCRAVDFVRHFNLPSYTQFAAIDIDALPRLLFMLFSVAALTVTGLFSDVGGLIIFCPLFPLMFTLVSFTPVTSLPVTMVMAFLFCFLVVFLHALPF